MRLRYSIALLFISLQFIYTNADLVLTPVHKYTAPPGAERTMSGPEAFGFGFMTMAIMAIATLIVSLIFLARLAARDVAERTFKRNILMWMSLGLGGLFGEAIVLLLPPAFGIYIFIYRLNGTKFNTNVIFSPYLVSMFILAGFFIFMITDMIARHKFIHSHTKMTHVPGINNSPSSSIRAEELAKRQPVAGNPNVVTGPTFVQPGGIGNNPNTYNQQQFNQAGVVGAQSTYVPGSTYVPVENIDSQRGLESQRGERFSTDSQNQGTLRRKTGPWEYSGTRKQSALIVFRQFMFVFYTAFAVGAAYGTESNYVAASVSIATAICYIILQTLDCLLLYYAGLTKGKIVGWWLFWTFFGLGMFAAVKGICAAGNQATAFMFAVAFGGFLYLVTLNLMPALMKERSGKLKFGYVLMFLFGSGAMFALRAIQ